MTTDFKATRAQFRLSPQMIYLDGNSLGPLPRGAETASRRVLFEEWGDMVITGWNRAGWMALPEALGDRIAKLIGAEAGQVVVGDTLSIRLFQALAAACAMTDRRVILSDTGNFPSDLYMAQGLVENLAGDRALRVVAPEEVEANLTEDVGVLMLTEVDYRTGRLHDMAALTEKAHALGIVTVWDLAHSAGAIEVDLAAARADFAVGCTYKYLNGGPGSPAFIYVAPHHADTAATVLNGWLGHAAPFDFEDGYRPAPGIARMRVGTPAIIQMRILEAALDVWDGVAMSDVRARSIELSERFIAGVEARCPALTLASPRDPARRGSQVSFRFAHGYAAMQALIARGVIGDFRAPDIMRFGFTPLYIGEAEVDAAIAHIAAVLTKQEYENPAHQARQRVT
ncbi:Kynureninase [Roseibacterium elongatum DSM 19469]|uniref:Kynureninase n=1 Tax=Roseicyclus elongatus DSM 19469 TaxID=1294273 RepID=W8RTA3_9RHOB|nr:kynureninase [Roseibacterium elongatum]AHM04388.1 Kynureninase [Roseibacterium elongatum DSM 19469]